MSDLVRLRVDLAYDGTDFAGWARQTGLRTVQGEVETALQRVLRLAEAPSTVCGGRTDAGVHARGQVVHVDVPLVSLGSTPEADLAIGRWRYRLDSVTAPDIVVQRVLDAPPDFDARFGALWRRYRYRVCDDPARLDPWRRADTLVYSRPLDVPAMNAAAQVVVGEHDFAAFCKRAEGATTIRRVHEVLWTRNDAESTAEMTIVADAFCRSMVRSLVGAFLMIGDGRADSDWLAQYLAAGVRGAGPNVVAAAGLVLDHIEYPPAGELAARVAQTRARRVPGAQPCS